MAMAQHPAPELVDHHDSLHQAPEDSSLEVYQPRFQAQQQWPAPHDSEAAEKHGRWPSRDERICGLRTRTFWIAMGVLAIIAIVGLIGGLAGALTTKKKADSESNDSANTSPSNTTSTTSTVAPSSSTSTPAALETIISNGQSIVRDCPSSNGTIYTANTSPPQKFIKHCSWLVVYDFEPFGTFEEQATSLDGCISLCAAYNAFNGTGQAGPCVSVAWRTDPRYDYWSYCNAWGAPKEGNTIGGKNATTEPGSSGPVDSAILLDFVPT